MIRPATREDAAAIAALEVRAWRWAYVDLVAEEDMPTVAEREARWRQEPLDGAWVWDQDGRVVGVVDIGAASPRGRSASGDRPEGDSADEPGVGALRGLYVDPPAQGAGIGAALHDHAVAELTAAGYAAATLWVFTASGHAREFYAARGWVPDGERGSWAGVSELRYRRTLAG